MMWVNVEVAVVRDGKYLAIERAAAEAHGGGWLCFPGGTVDPDPALDNAIEETARREVLEEVGLTIDGEIAYVESHVFMIDDGPVLDVVVLARSDQGEPVIASPDEVASVAWLTVDELMTDDRVQPFTQASIRLAEAERHRRAW